jgi:hypothetical protein
MPSELYPGFDRIGTSAPLAAARSRSASGTIQESLREIRDILRALDTGGAGDAPPSQPPSQGPSGAFPGAAGVFRTPVFAVPGPLSGGAAAISAPVRRARPGDPSRRRTVIAALTAAGLLALGAVSLAAVQPRLGDVSEVAARAVLPPIPAAAIATSGPAAAAPLPAAARPRTAMRAPRPPPATASIRLFLSASVCSVYATPPPAGIVRRACSGIPTPRTP